MRKDNKQKFKNNARMHIQTMIDNKLYETSCKIVITITVNGRNDAMYT